ncbi:MAG: HD domain-containing protein, partial [Nitrospinaceae bacterium]|nr:HD domain-containing protein [Nitrospinaceae bacterium]NIR54889.1 HD domain-containing protein [Nitrospinaceae bacterium]NIS85315.1 HD domain-containing protein [Nitrospinaceae bacterium]NIT82127.1 HD domain-containing protein [Nitrospinaceae bacterium]NIU44385.1 HD domain-containing protein [Nitrospinaceae bacterium]
PHETRESNRPLTKSEEALVRKHPAESTRMIRQLGYDSKILLNYVSSHHEQFDGSGYPEGLKGDQIPLGARILNVANDFDALTRRGIKKEGLNYQSALKELQKRTRAGRYDPQCVNALIQLLDMQMSPPAQYSSF